MGDKVVLHGVLIREGLSANGNFYSREVLEQIARLLPGRPVVDGDKLAEQGIVGYEGEVTLFDVAGRLSGNPDDAYVEIGDDGLASLVVRAVWLYKSCLKRRDREATRLPIGPSLKAKARLADGASDLLVEEIVSVSHVIVSSDSDHASGYLECEE